MSDESERIEVEILRETDKAWLCRPKGTPEGHERWLPKSQVWFHRRAADGKSGIADVPDWLLEKTGW